MNEVKNSLQNNVNNTAKVAPLRDGPVLTIKPKEGAVLDNLPKYADIVKGHSKNHSLNFFKQKSSGAMVMGMSNETSIEGIEQALKSSIKLERNSRSNELIKCTLKSAFMQMRKRYQE